MRTVVRPGVVRIYTFLYIHIVSTFLASVSHHIVSTSTLWAFLFEDGFLDEREVVESKDEGDIQVPAILSVSVFGKRRENLYCVVYILFLGGDTIYR